MTRMRVFLLPVLLAIELTFRFFVWCVTYISNLRKIGQKLRSTSRADRQTLKWCLPERDYATFGSLLSPIRLSSLCLSVTLVHPIQVVEAFRNISSPLYTLAILWPTRKILRRSSQGNPSGSRCIYIYIYIHIYITEIYNTVIIRIMFIWNWYCIYNTCLTETSCENGIVYNSTCYKIHREPVNWFTAVNRCLSNNGRLAVFDDHILTYFARTLLTEGPLWIGLIKSWWIWPDAGSSIAFVIGGCCVYMTFGHVQYFAVVDH